MPGLAGPNLGVIFGWADHEDGWGGPMNTNLRGLDTLVQLSAIDKDASAPPGSPVDGDRYLVGASATGDWAGHEDQVALFISGGWIFYVPREGWQCWLEDEDAIYVFDGTNWIIPTGSGGVTDHGALTGLLDDDHAQYGLLAGRSGGQTFIGGTGSGESLTLQSTANATRGKIFFGASSAYDEANVRLGIGTTSPQAGLHVGSLTRTGGGSTDGAIDGRLLLGNQANNFTTGAYLDIRGDAANNSTYVSLFPNMAALSGTASGGFTMFRVQTSGIPGYTAGSFTLTGMAFNPTLTVPSGVTISSLIPVDTNISFGATSGGAITELVGYRALLRGPSSAGPTIGTITGFYSSPSWRGNAAPSRVSAFLAIKHSTASYANGTATYMAAFEVDSTYGATALVTTWYGLLIPSISGPGTIWGIYQSGTMNSAIAGKTRFGSTTTPAHWIDIAAGTSTVAAMRFASGAALSPLTGMAGCVEWDGTRLYIIDSGPARQTFAYLSDTVGGGGGTHNLLSATHPDTTAASVARGDLITGQTATPKWQRLPLGAAGKFLKSDGTDAVWADLPAASGGTGRKHIPAGAIEGFQGATHLTCLARASGSNGTYHSMPLNNGQDAILQVTTDVPADFGSISAFNIWITPSDATAGNIKIKFGYRTIADAGDMTATTTLNTNTIAADAVSNNRIQVEAMDLTSMPSLSAGQTISIELQRLSSSDATDTYENRVNLVAIELVYTRA